MKNWKRFMAACLSVTMLATTPLTTLADNMSTTPVQKNVLTMKLKGM